MLSNIFHKFINKRLLSVQLYIVLNLKKQIKTDVYSWQISLRVVKKILFIKIPNWGMRIKGVPDEISSFEISYS